MDDQASHTEQVSIEKPPVSRVAVAALVFGVGSWFVCCIPGVTHLFGASALVLAAAGVWRIKSSRGQLRGTAAIVLAVVLATVGMSVGTAALAINAATVNQQKSLARVLLSIQAGATIEEVVWSSTDSPTRDTPKLNSAVRDKLTQSDLDAFATEINSRMGAFEFQPKSITESLRLRFTEESLQSKHTLGPMMTERFAGKRVRVQPVRFANGWAIVVMLSPQGPTSESVIDNIGFVPVESTEGTEPIWVIPPETMP